MSALKPFVVMVEGQPLASTEVIAKGMKAKHRTVIQLVRQYADELGQFGRVQFQIAPFATRGGVQQREVAMLNERQSALLLSLMRNSQEVVDFKIRLIAEFYRMRDALYQRDQSLWQQLQALIAREVESKVRASFGSHLMLQRKREMTYYQQERDRLETLMQPSLLMH
jgi:phage regulator Rha-like protein